MASQDVSALSSGDNVSYICCICSRKLHQPQVLTCLHVFCEGCLKKMLPQNENFCKIIECPSCGQETDLSNSGITGLPPDDTVYNRIDLNTVETTQIICGSCRAEETAVANCIQCGCFLCLKCKRAHEFMLCFESHTVLSIEKVKSGSDSFTEFPKSLNCTSHPGELLKFYCYTCSIPICSKCIILDHQQPEHCHEKADDVERKEHENLKSLVAQSKHKLTLCEEATVVLDTRLSELQLQRDSVQSQIEKTFQRYKSILEKQKKQLLEEIEESCSSQEIQLGNTSQNVKKIIQKIESACKFADRLLNCGDTHEVLSLSHVVQTQLLSLINDTPNLDIAVGMTFESNESKFEATIEGLLGYIKKSQSPAKTEDSPMLQRTSPTHSSSSFESDVLNFSTGLLSPEKTFSSLDVDFENNWIVQDNLAKLANLAECSASRNSFGDGQSPVCLNEILTPSTEYITEAPFSAINDLPAPVNMGSVSTSNALSPSRNQFCGPAFRSYATNPILMTIRYILGKWGSGQGEFNSPRGFCFSLKQDIIVADTNNHRIQVFDQTGYFIYQFGIPGKEGQLWYPRKVATIQSSGNIVVCDKGSEKSRMQIFTETGHFLKTVAIEDISIISGLTTTCDDKIIFVDSTTQKVYILHEAEGFLHSFDCSRYVNESSEIAFYKKELYICDYKGHCVVVFSEAGKFLRKIGSQNVTKFPTGIDINSNGNILVGDSHGNQFHVAVFSEQENLLCEFLCPSIIATLCCGLRITSESYVITLSKSSHRVLVLK